MKRGAVVWSIGLTLVTTSVAWGQISYPPGSLTVLSRPSGVAFRLTGDRVVVGRTPMMLERGLVGRFRVQSFEPGFEPWGRSVLLDGVSPDTLWMTLRSKSSVRAGLRSLLIPGWGQFYGERSSAGWVELIAGAAAVGVLAVTHLEYEDRVDDFDAATSSVDRRRAADRAEEAYDARNLALGVAAGVWAVSFLDAVAFFPRFNTGALTVSMGTRSGGDEARMAVVTRVRLR
jgi:hypothetical protein